MTVLQARKVGLPFMNLVRLEGMPIFKQLQLEEQLLRTSSDNWCIINDGTNAPAIVMGLSGFSGGGTVIVDSGTVFVTLICNKDAVPTVQPYPPSIMAWSGLLYDQVFQGIGDFQPRKNDYVFGDRKFGGSAQSITTSRWIHHTSFLWDYEVGNMDYLKVPERAPKYRLARDHNKFICRMKDYLPRSDFIEKTVEAVEAHFSSRQISVEMIAAPETSGFVHSTRLLTKHELEKALESPD